ncbi:hypothetical protein GOBAR_DD21787 [Gossypium barbadense]|nr:hypothetical protein GOBAR_DD21787 [Gossypium barbadense]
MFIQNFVAVQLPYMLFTGLEDYKARGTQASPCFTASFYTEFAESKDLVLIRGDIVFTSKLTDEEAKWLLEITQSFYLNDKLHLLLTKSLSIFGEKAPPERLEELLGIIEGQADLDARFDVSDADDIDRLISCPWLFLFLCYLLIDSGSYGSGRAKVACYIVPTSNLILNGNRVCWEAAHGMTIFHNVCALQLQEERKLDLLKALAEILPYTTPQDSRQILPSIVQLLKYMLRRKTGGKKQTLPMLNACYLSFIIFLTRKNKKIYRTKLYNLLRNKQLLNGCLSYDCNPLFNFNVEVQVGCEPTSHISLGPRVLQWKGKFEMSLDLSSSVALFVEDLTRAIVKKLTLGMAENNKAMAAAKSDEAKDSIKTQKQNTTTSLQICNNILAMTRVDRSENCLLGLASLALAFIGDKSVNLSWKEAIKPSAPSTVNPTGQVDSCYTTPAANGSNNLVTKKGRGAGGMQNQLVNRALDGISFSGRGGRRSRGRSWGWAGRRRGRGYL